MKKIIYRIGTKISLIFLLCLCFFSFFCHVSTMFLEHERKNQEIKDWSEPYETTKLFENFLDYKTHDLSSNFKNLKEVFPKSLHNQLIINPDIIEAIKQEIKFAEERSSMADEFDGDEDFDEMFDFDETLHNPNPKDISKWHYYEHNLDQLTSNDNRNLYYTITLLQRNDLKITDYSSLKPYQRLLNIPAESFETDAKMKTWLAENTINYQNSDIYTTLDENMNLDEFNRYTYYFKDNAHNIVTTPKDQDYKFTLFVRKEINGNYYTSSNDLSSNYISYLSMQNFASFVNFPFINQSNPIPGLICTILVGIFFLIILTLGAARRAKEPEKACPNLQDKLPLDLYLPIAAVLFISACSLLLELRYINVLLLPILALGVGMSLFILCLATYLTIVARIKLRTLFTNTMIYRLFFVGKKLWSYFPFFVKLAALLIPMSLILFIALQISIGLFLFISFCYCCLGVAWLLLFKRLAQETMAIRQGHLIPLKTNYLFGELKKHAEDINQINEGLSEALHEKIKHEQLKTELITNVSHDLKTPLTSILNYVDLIQKITPLPSEAKKHLAVIEKQSIRLKNLTNSILKISKVNSGNMNLQLTDLNVSEFLNQITAEYKNKFKTKNLDFIITEEKDKNLYLTADSQQLWQVFQNVLDNIIKYALPETRVYLDIIAQESTIVFTLKNISRIPLNISAESLLQRFVQGDTSRNTEGAGLGLAIAKDLMELQNGELKIDIDGDLFKLKLIFPRKT